MVRICVVLAVMLLMCGFRLNPLSLTHWVQMPAWLLLKLACRNVMKGLRRG